MEDPKYTQTVNIGTSSNTFAFSAFPNELNAIQSFILELSLIDANDNTAYDLSSATAEMYIKGYNDAGATTQTNIASGVIASNTITFTVPKDTIPAALAALPKGRSSKGNSVIFIHVEDTDSQFVLSQRVNISDGGFDLDGSGAEAIPAEISSYTPNDATDWDVTPTKVAGALDELAQRINDDEDALAALATIASSGLASDAAYTPADGANWTDPDPTQAAAALDALAARMNAVEATTINYKGYYADETALTTAYPSGSNGWYAVLGSTDTFWVWDTDTVAWVDSGSGTGDMVAATYDPAGIAQQLVGTTAAQTISGKTISGQKYTPSADPSTPAAGDLAENLDSTSGLIWRKDSSGYYYCDEVGYSENANSSRCSYPKGAMIGVAGTNNTDAIKITLPVSWDDTFQKFIVDIYDFETGGVSGSLLISGYNRTSSTDWGLEDVKVIAGESDYRVRFGHDGSKCCVVIGTEGAEDWDAPVFIVRDWASRNSGKKVYGYGWSVSTISATTGITFTGDVTARPIDPSYINNLTSVAPASGDKFLLWDATDSTLKKIDYDDLPGAAGGETNTLAIDPSATGTSIVSTKSGTELRVKGLIEGNDINITAGTYDLTIDVDRASIAAGTDNNQTGTSYTLVLTDADLKTVWMNNASANTLTVPTNASVAFPVGTKIQVIMEGAGATSITGDTGVTVNGTSGGTVTINNQYSGAMLSKRATDTWIVTGDVS